MAWFQSFFGGHEGTTTKQDITMFDVITYVASLASNPREIDPILDTIREISSRLKPGESLSAADEAALSVVYKNIEQYLTEQDPLRRLSPDEVRRRVHGRFPTFDIKLN